MNVNSRFFPYPREYLFERPDRCHLNTGILNEWNLDITDFPSRYKQEICRPDNDGPTDEYKQ